MSYVLKVINKEGEEMYLHTTRCAVYCPELAAKYYDRKCAVTMKNKLLSRNHFKKIEVVNYTYDIVVKAHLNYQKKGEKIVNGTIRKIIGK